MMTQTSLNLVTRELVLEDQRLAITEKMAEEYDGGYWDFFTLSNGGFYMAPEWFIAASAV